MNLRIAFLLVFGLIFDPNWTICASTPTPTPTPKPAIIYNHFRVLAWLTPLQNISFSQNLPSDPNFKDIPIVDDSRFRSPFYPYEKSKPLYILQSGNGVKSIAATLDLSQVPDLPLILLKTNVAGLLSPIVYSDDLKSFPGGCYRLINFTDQSINVTFDKLAVLVNPNDTQIYIPTNGSDHALQIQVNRTDNNKRVYSNMLPHNESVRWIFFFVEDSAQEISFLRLSDLITTVSVPTPTPTPTRLPTPTPKKKHHQTS